MAAYRRFSTPSRDGHQTIQPFVASPREKSAASNEMFEFSNHADLRGTLPSPLLFLLCEQARIESHASLHSAPSGTAWIGIPPSGTAAVRAFTADGAQSSTPVESRTPSQTRCEIPPLFPPDGELMPDCSELRRSPVSGGPPRQTQFSPCRYCLPAVRPV